MRAETGKILIVDDDAEVLLAAELVLKRRFPTVVTACTPASIELLLAQHSFDVILLDMNFTAGATSGEEGIYWLKVAHRLAPDAKVVLMTAYGGVNEAVHAMREGAADFVVKPWDNAKLVATVSAVAQLSRADREVKQLRGQQRTLNDLGARDAERIVGETGGMRQVIIDIEKVARTDANVLITGENGTGKELVARAIHRQSSRNEQPFVGVDLGAITETLFESELFGHRKGAFTDAREDRAGRFEAASGGTLFLDEIGNLSLAMQAKLLGALETMMVSRVGSDRLIRVDARVICATNLSPAQLRDPQRFRQDLLYRINTIEIRIPRAARKTGGHPAADCALRRALHAQVRAPRALDTRGGAGPAARVSMAGQCARAQARGRARRDHERERILPSRWHRVPGSDRRKADRRCRDTEPRRTGKDCHPAGHRAIPGQPHAGRAGPGPGAHHALSQDGASWPGVTFASTSPRALRWWSSASPWPIWGWVVAHWLITPIVAGLLALLLVIELIWYVERSHRDLSGFLATVAHQDYSVPLAQQKKGRVFDELERAYRVLSEEFRRLNLQKAANHQYLEAVVEHVGVALISLDDAGNVVMVNEPARALFGQPLLSQKSFARFDPRLPELLGRLNDGDRDLLRVQRGDDTLQLVLYCTSLTLLDHRHRLVSFQNIRDELEKREIESWQKLIRVLTHEIMNSVTPIISLSKLIQETLSGDGPNPASPLALSAERAQRPAAQRQCRALTQQRTA